MKNRDKQLLRCVVVAFAVTIFLPGGSLAAQQQVNSTTYVEPSAALGPGPARLEFFGKLGLIGNLNLEASMGSRSEAVDIDMNPTLVGGIGFEYVIADYFSLGARLRLGSASLDSDSLEEATGNRDGDNVFLVEPVLVPRGRFPLANGQLAIYGMLPVGLTVFVPDNDDADSEVGWNIGFAGGAEYFLAKNFGLFAEVGWQGRFYSTEILGIDSSWTFSELTLGAGGKVAF